MAAVLRITFVVTFLTCWMTFWYSGVAAQEYLPPKNGKKPAAAAEPTQPANYNYSYDVQDNTITLDFGHNEKRKDDRTTGSYHVLLPDGRMQLVEYEAGPNGYKPVIMYMGTATYPAANNNDKFDGYHYNAASNRQSVRQAAPRSRQPPPAPPAPAPSVVATVTHPPPSKSSNSTKNSTQ